jgi:hypothetical protein
MGHPPLKKPSLDRQTRFVMITKTEPYWTFFVMITNCGREMIMGDFRKHLSIAREKLDVLTTAYTNGQHTVVGDLGTKVVEQLIEADAARTNNHLGTHFDRHAYAQKEYGRDINHAMKKIWFGYGDLGYDGVNGKRAKEVFDNLKRVVGFFEKRFGEQIEPETKS